MKLINTETEIASFFDKYEFVQNTLKQINKDLIGLSSKIMDLERRYENASQLSQTTEQLVDVLTNMNNDALRQFIYKVDIPEKTFQSALAENNYEALAYFIIRREAQKVFIREHYK